MSENIKNTAITAAGYIYQNRQGLKVLCDWLDAPARYIRMKFECDDENVAPTGLDDIVIERSDGLVDHMGFPALAGIGPWPMARASSM